MSGQSFESKCYIMISMISRDRPIVAMLFPGLGAAAQDLQTAQEFLGDHAIMLANYAGVASSLQDIISTAKEAADNYMALVIEGMCARALENKLLQKRDGILKAQDVRVKTENIPTTKIHKVFLQEMERAVNK